MNRAKRTRLLSQRSGHRPFMPPNLNLRMCLVVLLAFAPPLLAQKSARTRVEQERRLSEEIRRYQAATIALKHGLPLVARVVDVDFRPRNSPGQPGKPSVIDDGGFVSTNLTVAVVVTESAIRLNITNRGGSTARILWSEAVFISGDGHTHSLANGNAPIMGKDEPMPPAVLITGSTANALLYPSNYVSWVESAWDAKPIFTASDMTRTLRVAIPIDRLGVVTDVVLELRVDVAPAAKHLLEDELSKLPSGEPVTIGDSGTVVRRKRGDPDLALKGVWQDLPATYWYYLRAQECVTFRESSDEAVAAELDCMPFRVGDSPQVVSEKLGHPDDILASSKEQIWWYAKQRLRVVFGVTDRRVTEIVAVPE